MSNPLPSAQDQGSPPLSPPSPAAGLGQWKPVGPCCGVVAGERISRAGERSVGGLLARRTMAVSEGDSSFSECLFFGGGGHEDGPQHRGKSLEFEQRGWGAVGTGHRVSTE
jgi:hypothetical protein